jgi:hypothetical protein
VGTQFEVRAWVEDLRSSAQGVFAAYADVQYDDEKAAPTGLVQHGETYVNGTSAGLDQPGLLGDAGGFAGLDLVGEGEELLFRAEFRAMSSGLLSFIPGPADGQGLDFLLYGLNHVVPESEVIFVGSLVEVVGGLLGDLDGSGHVDLFDFRQFKQGLGDHAACPACDFNEDGSVDLTDFVTIKSQFGKSTSAVPEPTTLCLAIVGLGAFISMQFRRPQGRPRYEARQADSIHSDS